MSDAGDEHDDQPCSPADSKMLWQNRERMAWVALWAMFVFTAALFAVAVVPKLNVQPDMVEKLASALTWLYVACASVVGSFMGFKTWSTIRGR